VAGPPANPGYARKTSAAGGSSVLTGFAALLIVILMARPFDVILVGLHIPMVICGAAIIAVGFTGGLRGLNTRTGRLIAAYVFWMLVVSPFSMWKGGSVQYVKSFALLLVVLFLAVAESPKNLSATKKLMQVLGYSVTLAAVVFAAMGKGKAEANPAEAYRSGGLGMFGNEGEFALLIGFVLPFWVFTASTIKNKVLRLALMGGGSIYLLWLLVMTGTRSALLAMIPVCILLLVRLPMSKRLMLVGVGVVFCIAIIGTAPRKVLDRLATLSTTVPDGNDLRGDAGASEAVASTAERKQLFRDALETIARNPVMGVGPGNFADYRYSVLGKEGIRKTWFPAHDTYMQIGAESGVPGALLYIAMVLSVFTALHIVRKRIRPGDPQAELLNQMTLCLQSALLFYAIMSAFQNCDRYPHLFVLAGFATALERLTKAPAPPTGPVASPGRTATAFGPVRRSPVPAPGGISRYRNPA
jgi:O-antigen ligase